MDPIPVLSQLKSLVQVTLGQREQARQTQINFSRQCPVVSQARSAVEAIKGDPAAARETQKEFGRFALGVVNSVPVAGHISGVIHYVVGDKVGGDQAMKAASHTTAVMAGGIGGFFIAGPVGSIALGIGAGAAMDSTITAIDTAVHWKRDRKVRTFGLTEPLSDPKNVGKWFDAICGLALDGVTAFGAGKLAQQIRIRSGARGSPVKAVKDFETIGTIRPATPSMTVFLKVAKGVLTILEQKATQIALEYVIEHIKDGVFKTVRLAGHDIFIWIKNKIVHVRDASGIDQVLQEGNIYTVTHSTGKVDKVKSKMMQDYMESIYNHECIDERENKNSVLTSIKLAKPEQKINTCSVEETEDESIDESSVEETDDESRDESSVEETDDESSDESSVEETEDESRDESSNVVTDDESSDESSVEETDDESRDESSVEETDDESSEESSNDDTEDESSDTSSVEEADDESSDESSVEETDDESSEESSNEDTEDESSDGSSNEDAEDESSDGSSNEDTEDEISDESSSEDTEDENSDESSVEETEMESSDEGSNEEADGEINVGNFIKETLDESVDESSIEDTEDESRVTRLISRRMKEKAKCRGGKKERVNRSHAENRKI